MTSRKRASRKPVSRKRASRKPLFRKRASRKPVSRKRASRKPLFRKIVVCKEDEERNQVTGRCRKKCKDNEERNQNTGRCRKIRSVVASRKPVSKKVASRRKKIVVCKNDEEINQATGRCRKKCKDNEERNEKTGRCRKPVSKKVASRKPVSKKVASRKPVSKKVTFILPTEEHIYPKNVSPKNVSPKNVSPKNVSPKNVSPKNVSPKNVSPKNVSPKSNLINIQPNVSNKIISKEMLTRRLSYKNKLNLELKDAENFINKTEESIKRLRTSGYKKDYVETQLLKMQNTLEKYEDLIISITNKLEKLQRGELDDEINQEYVKNKIVQDEHMKKKHNEKQEKETKKKDAINNAKKENNSKKHEFQQPTKKEMENQFRYMSKVHQSLPYFMKQNLSKMPNNKGYIWKGVNYYGKLPENPNEPRVLLEKKDDVLITHEYTGTEYRRFEKVGKEKQVLVFASKIK
jgi:hypothetical protein